MLGSSWGWNLSWPGLSCRLHLYYIVFLSWEAIGFSLQEQKMCGGPGEDAWPHSLRIPKAAWKRGSQSHREAATAWPPGAVEE